MNERSGRVGGLTSLGSLAWLLAAVCIGPVEVSASSPIRFDHISLDEGLSQSSINAVFQDSRGFLWLGTEDGLNRYDGREITVYKHDAADSTSITSGFIYAIEEDVHGDLWLGTDGGLTRWDSATDSFETLTGGPEDLVMQTVRALHFDRRGGLWIGSPKAGLARFDPVAQRFVRFRHDPAVPESLSSDAVYAIYEDRRGKIWVGTDSGLNCIDPKTSKVRRFLHAEDRSGSLGGDRVRAILEDRRGRLWVGSLGGGLSRLISTEGKFVRYVNDPDDPASLASDTVQAILEDDRGRLWVGTGRGLGLLVEGDRFQNFSSQEGDRHSLSDPVVTALMQDRGGVLWVGTRSGGVNKWNPATWSFGHRAASPDDALGLSGNNVTSFAEDLDGGLWVGTFGDGLNRLSGSAEKVTHFRADPNTAGSLSDDWVMSMAADARGSIWAGTMRGGLNRLDRGGRSFRHYRHQDGQPGSLSANGVMSVIVDSTGTLWAGTYRGGLNRYEPSTDSFTSFRHAADDPQSLSSDIVTALAEDPSGALWVGTEGGGLNLFDRSGRSIRFGRRRGDPTSLSSETVYALHVDDSGRLWVGTRGGGLDQLVWLDREAGRARFENHSERDGLANNNVYSIQPGDTGQLWLSTNRGLSRFDYADRTFTNFGASRGLQGSEFNFGASLRRRSGELLFGGPQGYNAFFPDRIEVNGHAPPVVLTSVSKLAEPLATEGPIHDLRELKLDYRDDMITLEFAALDYAAPEQNQYAYRLDGFDSDWIDLGSIRRVTYTNLPAGNYTFRVRAANSDGTWSESGLALPVTVAPAPWQTWWAKLAYLLTLFGLVFAGVRHLRRKARLETEYRGRLEADVEKRTHELLEQQKRLRLSDSILRRVRALVVVSDADGGVAYASPSVKEVLGYEPEEVMGDGWWRVERADDLSAEQDYVAKCASGEAEPREAPYERTLIDRDGREHSILWKDGLGPDGMLVGVGHDITERHRADEALRESKALYEALFEGAQDAILLLEDGRLREANRRAAELFGCARDELIGEPLGRLCPERQADGCPSQATLESRIETALAGKPLFFEWCYARTDGTTFETEVSLSLVQLGGTDFVQAIIRDITERQSLELQVHQAQKMEAIGRLAGGVAHDFNNLLTAINGYARMIVKSPTGADTVKRQAQEIHNAGERAAELTSQLLSFSRRQMIQPKELDLNTTIGASVDMFQRLIGEHIELETRLESEPWHVNADPGQFSQVLMNLIVNARDAMPEGGHLTIETRNVELDAAPVQGQSQPAPGQFAMLAVGDSGAGMDEATKAQVFEPFFTTKRQGEGTGLGLSTSYGIVRQIGGHISVETKLGEGTTFRVFLPRFEGEALPQEAVEQEVLAGSETVMLVEDEEAVRRVTQEMLRSVGYTVLAAADGSDALRQLETYSNPVDLLISDVVMPGMSGPQLAERVVELRPRTRVMFVSGHTQDAIGHHGILDESLAFLHKPFSVEILAHKVREVLGRRNGTGDLHELVSPPSQSQAESAD